jgi:outer membrane protein
MTKGLRMKITGKISLGLGVFALVASAAATAQDVKIAVVNIELLVSQSPQFLAAQAKMEDEFAPKARELRSRQEAFQQKAEQLQRDAEVMGQAEREAAERELSTEQRAIARAQNELQEEVQIREREVMGPVQQDVFRQVQAFGKAEGYDVILAQGILYASERVDLTQSILEQLKASEAAE